MVLRMTNLPLEETPSLLPISAFSPPTPLSRCKNKNACFDLTLAPGPHEQKPAPSVQLYSKLEPQQINLAGNWHDGPQRLQERRGLGGQDDQADPQL